MNEAYQTYRAGLIRLVQVSQETEGTPGSFPNTTQPTVYKCKPATVTIDPVEGGVVSVNTNDDPDRAIYVANFRANNPILGNYYLVFRLDNGTYVFDNQAAFQENQ